LGKRFSVSDWNEAEMFFEIKKSRRETIAAINELGLAAYKQRTGCQNTGSAYRLVVGSDSE
jgi:hypothetical protein